MSARVTSLGAVLSLCALVFLSGCRAGGGAEGDSPAEQRATILKEQAATLDQLYAARPEMRAKVRNAAGHAFFSNVNVNLILLSTENGYGTLHDNAANRDTFMKMAGAGVGLGMGVKDFRVVFIFTDPKVMKQFVEKGWDFAAQADAAAKAGDSGGNASAAGSSTSVAGMEIYQFTKNGLALQATVQGTKYWRDDKLNK